MYRINVEDKTINEMEEVRFQDMGVKERYDIQQWIKYDPRILGEDLLIIQEEFDGFDMTKERLDLMALDKNGNLVVIENKRDDSGKYVDWQAIKYVSYCSTLSKLQIIDIYKEYLRKNNKDIDAEKAENEINNFLDNDSLNYPTNIQRIILVAGKFDNEALSAAQWLLNNGIDISCVQLKPYKYKDEYILDSDIILPQKELKEYLLQLAAQKQDIAEQQKNNIKQSELQYQEFWGNFHQKYDMKNTAFENRTSWNNNKCSWMNASAELGVSGINYQFVANKKEFRMELYIETLGDATYHQSLFDFLYNNKLDIEEIIGQANWKKGEGVSSKVAVVNNNFSLDNRDDWEGIFDFFIENLEKFEKAFSKYKGKMPLK